MGQHHPARCTAGTRGVDDAGGVIAAQSGGPVAHGLVGVRAHRQHLLPIQHGEAGGLGQTRRLQADQGGRLAGPGRRRHHPLGQGQGRDDDQPGLDVFQDVTVIVGGVGDIGRHGDAAGDHDGQIGDGPFGPVFRHQHDAVAGFQPQADQTAGQGQGGVDGLPPRQIMPGAVTLGPQQGAVSQVFGLIQDHGRDAGAGCEIHRHDSSHWHLIRAVSRHLIGARCLY